VPAAQEFTGNDIAVLVKRRVCRLLVLLAPTGERQKGLDGDSSTVAAFVLLAPDYAAPHTGIVGLEYLAVSSQYQGRGLGAFSRLDAFHFREQRPANTVAGLSCRSMQASGFCTRSRAGSDARARSC
jgi:hypothetical protein